jgi:UDP-N-acetylglucosamine 4,6-dehydratase
MPLSGNILVTGGSGTLGRAIVRTAERENWDCSITIYSRSELRQAQMRSKHPRCRYVLGDVRDYERLAAAVAGHDLVIHGAAMKRIPECETNPAECYATNVQGSINIARACIAAGIKRCVGVSTDKAVRAITCIWRLERRSKPSFVRSRHADDLHAGALRQRGRKQRQRHPALAAAGERRAVAHAYESAYDSLLDGAE